MIGPSAGEKAAGPGAFFSREGELVAGNPNNYSHSPVI